MSGVGLVLVLIIIIIIVVLLIWWFTSDNSKDKKGKGGKGKKYWIRSYDGKGNNPKHYNLGSVGTLMVRKSDKHNHKTLEDGVNPRVISNALCKTIKPEKDAYLTNMFWMWGQFLDHEITLVGEGEEEVPIVTPKNDQYPGRIIPFKRSAHKKVKGQREFQNLLSCYIDGANVYGFDRKRARVLRTMDGTGKMKVSHFKGEILPPLNTYGLENANPHKVPADTLFVAGDVRCNENTMLLGLHTLFLREHNRLCDLLKDDYGYTSGEEIYQQARRIVVAQMQRITYEEFLPCIMDRIEYHGYDVDVDPQIRLEFSTAGYRFGHTLLSSKNQVGKDKRNFVLLRDVFFNVQYPKDNGVDAIIQGATLSKMGKFNSHLIDDVRDFLFEVPTEHMMLDLASLNLQRGRDHTVPGYNDCREAYGLERYENFSQITKDPLTRVKLAELYETPDDIDLWVGALSETPKGRYVVGELTSAMLREQFHALMHGDRFYYKNDEGLSDEWKRIVDATTLGQIINHNCSGKVDDDVFRI